MENEQKSPEALHWDAIAENYQGRARDAFERLQKLRKKIRQAKRELELLHSDPRLAARIKERRELEIGCIPLLRELTAFTRSRPKTRKKAKHGI